MEERKSLLESTMNTRELGGYRTGQGTYTSMNRLIRSDSQNRLSERDITWLLERQITTILDMRGRREAANSPSPFLRLASFQYYHVPIEEGSRVPESVQEVPSSYMRIAGAAGMGKVFQTIARAPQGVLFHCAAGKDRTGVVSAILLLLAGVSDEDIVENYMLTKEYNRKRFARIRKNFPDLDINIVIPDEEYMVRFLALFRERYGNVKAYLQSIGLEREEIQMLEQKLEM